VVGKWYAVRFRDRAPDPPTPGVGTRHLPSPQSEECPVTTDTTPAVTDPVAQPAATGRGWKIATVAALTVSALTLAWTASLTATVDDLSSEVAQLQAQTGGTTASTDAQVASLTEQVDYLESALATLVAKADPTVAAAQEAYQTLLDDLADANTAIADLEQDLGTTQATQQEQSDAFTAASKEVTSAQAAFDDLVAQITAASGVDVESASKKYAALVADVAANEQAIADLEAALAASNAAMRADLQAQVDAATITLQDHRDELIAYLTELAGQMTPPAAE
jgi:chromosome segregation ATPase